MIGVRSPLLSASSRPASSGSDPQNTEHGAHFGPYGADAGPVIRDQRAAPSRIVSCTTASATEVLTSSSIAAANTGGSASGLGGLETSHSGESVGCRFPRSAGASAERTPSSSWPERDPCEFV